MLAARAPTGEHTNERSAEGDDSAPAMPSFDAGGTDSLAAALRQGSPSRTLACVRETSRGFRIACWVMGAYFAFAAAVQINDPDAWLWLAFYAVASAVSLYSSANIPPAWMPAVLALLAAVWAAVLMPRAFESSFGELFRSWQMMSPGMEVGREMLGLIVVAVWMAILAVHARGVEASARLSRAAAERS